MELLYSEIEDEITDIVDRFRHAESDDVVLVLPRGSMLAQSLVNLKLLQRESQKLGLQLSLVTSDPVIRHLATEAGLTAQSEVPEELDPTVEEEQAPSPDEVGEQSEAQVPRDFTMRSIPVKAVSDEVQDDASDLEEVDEAEERHLDEADQQEVVSEMSPLPDPVVSDVVATSSKGVYEASDVDVVEPTEEKLVVREDSRKKDHSVRHAQSASVLRRSSPAPQKVSLLPRMTRFAVIAALVIAVLVGGGVLLWVLPSATVTVQPQREPFEEELRVQLSASASAMDATTGVVPGVPIAVEEVSPKRSFAATGVTTEEGTKARGEVTITNAYSAAPQPLVATTRFLAKDGTLFRLIEHAVVPGMDVSDEGELIPTTITVEVEADQPGSDYNMEPTSFTIPGLAPAIQEKMTGKSVTPFTGGTNAGTGERIISQRDMDAAVAIMKQEAVATAAESLRAQVAEGEAVLEEALRTDVIEVRSTGDVGDAREDFELELLVTARTLAYREEDLRSTVFAQLQPRLPEGRAFIDKTFSGVTFSLASYDTTEEVLELDVQMDRDVVVLLPEEGISAQLQGKTAEEVQHLLFDQYGVAAARVAFWPFWVEHVPRVPGKVDVVLDTAEDEQ